jgi:esterase/lipase superfamily enzyme
MESDETSRAIVAAIAQIWPDLPRAVDGDWGDFQSAVLARLAALEDAELAVAAAEGDDDEIEAALTMTEFAQKDLWDLFSTHPIAHDRLKQQSDETLKVRRGFARPPAGSTRYNVQRPFFTIPVFYATDRKRAGPPKWYTGERASSEDLSYGVIITSMPANRKVGERPSRMSRSFKVLFKSVKLPGFNPQKYCEIMSVDPERASGFVERAGDFVRAGRGGADDAEAGALRPGAAEAHDALVFIHGYNVSFEAAAKRAAQFAYDLDFTGVIVLYSWPARGTAMGYTADRNNAEWSTPHFVRFVREVLPEIEPHQIHVVAHSMGNEILARAAAHLDASAGHRLGHVVFVAPDVDEGVFRQLADSFGDQAVSYTLYMSLKDLALGFSGLVGGNPRIGREAKNLGTMARIEIIDASRLPKTDLLGHSGFAEGRTMLNDLKDLLIYDRPADQRSGIEPRSDENGQRYWMFPA